MGTGQLYFIFSGGGGGVGGGGGGGGGGGERERFRIYKPCWVKIRLILVVKFDLSIWNAELYNRYLAAVTGRKRC